MSLQIHTLKIAKVILRVEKTPQKCTLKMTKANLRVWL